MPDRPKFEKSPPELVDRFRAVLDRHTAPDISVRPMFGYPCAWIAGNMFTGLFAAEWWVRVSELDRERLLALPMAKPFQVMPGRDMGRYVVMPPDLTRDDTELDAWLLRSIDHTRSLPPKKK